MIEIEKRGLEYLNGICDLHVYALPSVFVERAFTEIELARQARDVGYCALLFKDHHTINADRVQHVRTVVPGIEIFGGVVLNYPVGGLNPEAVEAAINYGAKEVWMPSLHAAGHEAYYGSLDYGRMTMKFRGKKRPLKGITIFDSEKRILPEVYDILELINEADIILGMAHLTTEEVFSLLKVAKDIGIKKVLVQHCEASVTKRSIEEQTELAEKGAFIEHVFSVIFHQETTADLIAQAIRKHGAHRGILATDCGNIYTPHPIEAMRLFITMMLRCGISKDDLDLLTKKVPSSLLNLE